MAPDSRRSESIGLPPLRSSTFRLSWLSARIGTSSSLASALRERLISAHLELPALDLALLVHELEVVDDQQPQALASCCFSRRALARRSNGRERAGVVDEERRVEQAPGDLLELLLVVRGQPAAAQLLHVHPGRRWPAGASGADRRASPARRCRPACSSLSATCIAMFIASEVFPMPGRAARIDQLARVEPGELQVEVDEAGGQAGDARSTTSSSGRADRACAPSARGPASARPRACAPPAGRPGARPRRGWHPARRCPGSPARGSPGPRSPDGGGPTGP